MLCISSVSVAFRCEHRPLITPWESTTVKDPTCNCGWRDVAATNRREQSPGKERDRPGRSTHSSTCSYPGMLDTVSVPRLGYGCAAECRYADVGGAVPAEMGVFDALIKESEEEASLPASLLRHRTRTTGRNRDDGFASCCTFFQVRTTWPKPGGHGCMASRCSDADHAAFDLQNTPMCMICRCPIETIRRTSSRVRTTTKCRLSR